jgi:uncharacterized protein YneF (UPF0154 family)
MILRNIPVGVIIKKKIMNKKIGEKNFPNINPNLIHCLFRKDK